MPPSRGRHERLLAGRIRKTGNRGIGEIEADVRVLPYSVFATAAEKPLPHKGQESFPSWTSPVRPRSPALSQTCGRFVPFGGDDDAYPLARAARGVRTSPWLRRDTPSRRPSRPSPGRRARTRRDRGGRGRQPGEALRPEGEDGGRLLLPEGRDAGLHQAGVCVPRRVRPADEGGHRRLRCLARLGKEPSRVSAGAPPAV